MPPLALVLALSVAGSPAIAGEDPSMSVDQPSERYSKDWGPGYLERLREIFKRVVADSGFSLVLRTRVQLLYFADKRFVAGGDSSGENGSPAAAVDAKSPRNTTGLPEVWVGFNLLETAKSEDEIAFVLAHEVAHLGERHRLIHKREAVRLWRKFKREHRDVIKDDPATAKSWLESRGRLLLMTLSPCLEDAADRIGQKIMADAGFDPRKATDHFGHFEDYADAVGLEIGNGGAMTHSPIDERVEQLELALDDEDDDQVDHLPRGLSRDCVKKVRESDWYD